MYCFNTHIIYIYIYIYIHTPIPQAPAAAAPVQFGFGVPASSEGIMMLDNHMYIIMIILYMKPYIILDNYDSNRNLRANYSLAYYNIV